MIFVDILLCGIKIKISGHKINLKYLPCALVDSSIDFQTQITTSNIYLHKLSLIRNCQKIYKNENFSKEKKIVTEGF